MPAIINVGLCEGRHPIPGIIGYVYPMEVNPLDVQGLYDKALDFVSAHKDEHINLYVTGLTVALVSIIKACMELHVSLTLYHYDRESNGYYPQEVIS